MDTKILLIDDETRIRQTFARTLKRAGYTVLTAAGGEEGLALYHQEEPDIVLLDLRMPGVDGLEVLQAMREEDSEANVILVTGHDDQDVVIEALRAGAADLLPKPVDQTALERALRRAEERVHLKRKLRASQEALRRQNERLEEEIKARTAKLEREIEERKEIEKALLESEQRYKEAERVGHFGSWRMDIATGKSVWSDEFFRICGYEPGSIEPSSEVGFKIIHPDDRERAAQKVNATIETGTPYDIEKRIVQPDGTIRWVRSIGEVNYDEQGKPAELVGSFHDITEQKRAEDALRESEARYRKLIENMHDLVYRYEIVPERGFTYISPSATDITGYTPEEHYADPDLGFKIVYPEDRPLLERLVRGEGDIQTPVVLRWVHKKGEIIWVEQRNSPIYDDEKNHVAIEGIAHDITERKQAEEALRESEERFRMTVHRSPIGVGIVDSTGQLTDCNTALAEMVGYRREELLHLNFTDFTHPDDVEREWQLINDLWAGGTTEYRMEKRYIHRKGHTIWVDVAASLFKGETGELTFGFAFVQDITERKRAEEASRQYTARLRIQHEIDAAILAAQSPEEIAQVALTRLCDLIACQQSSITEIDPVRRRGRDLVVLVGGKLQVKPTAWYPLSRAGSLIDTVQRGDVHHVDDITALETPSPLEQRLVENGIRSYVSMPLLVQDTLQGTLNLSSDTPGFFQPDHVEILKEIADSLAIALQQARLREQTQRDAEMKALLLREVNHRVLNNLAAIMAILDMEQRRSLDDKADFRAVLHDVAHRIGGMTTVHRMLSGAQWRPLDLSEVVERVTHAALSGSPIQRQVEVVIDRPDAPLRVTSKQAIALALVINELTTNSVKYAFRDRAQGRIQVGITPLEGRRVRLTFRDDGPGMDDEVLAGERRNVGLWLVETNVKHTLGGEVEFHNEDGAVTAFTFKRAPLG